MWPESQGTLGSQAELPSTSSLPEAPLLPTTWKGARPHQGFTQEQLTSLLNVAAPGTSWCDE